MATPTFLRYVTDTIIGEFVSYLPYLVSYLMELAALDAEHGENKTMQQWYDTIMSLLEDLKSKCIGLVGCP